MKKLTAMLLAAGMLMDVSKVVWAAESSDVFAFYQEELKVITASKKEEKISEAPGIIQVVTADEIRQFGANNLTDVLERLTSVYLIGSHLFRDNVPSIRGDLSTHNDVHTLVLINGRPYRSSQSARDYPVYRSFPIESIDHIEVIRGPGSVLYGTGAFAGVINVITEEAKPGKIQAMASAGGGNFGAQRYTANLGKKGENYNVNAGYQYYYASGWPFGAFDAPFPNPVTPTNRSDYHRVPWGQKDMGANLDASYKNLKLTMFYALNDTTDLNTLPLWPDANLRSYHLLTDLGYLQPLTDRWDVSLNFTNNLDYCNLPNTNPAGLATYSAFTSRDYLTEITARGRPVDNVNILVGALNNHVTGPDTPKIGTPSYPAYNEDLWGGYLQTDYKPIPKLKLIAGAQINAPQGDKANTVPRGGAIYNFNQEWGTKVLYGQAFRSAYNVEQHINIAALAGNPELVPEKTAATDINIFHNTEKSQSAVTFFYIEQKDLFARVNVGSGPRQTFANQVKIISRGVELETKLSPWEHWKLTGSYSYQDNRNANGQSNFTLMPSNMVKAGASYDWPQGVTLGMFNSYYSKRYDVFLLNSSRPVLNPEAKSFNWLTANLALNLNKLFAWKVAQEYIVNVYGINLLDEAVYDPEFDRWTVNTLPSRTRASFLATLSARY